MKSILLLVLLTINTSTSIKWSIDEPIRDITNITISDILLCNSCDNPLVDNSYDYLVQLYTKNYIYYVNKTTGIIIEKIHIIDNIGHEQIKCYSTKPNMVCNWEAI